LWKPEVERYDNVGVKSETSEGQASYIPVTLLCRGRRITVQSQPQIKV
jgi:hypothetical protein